MANRANNQRPLAECIHDVLRHEDTPQVLKDSIQTTLDMMKKFRIDRYSQEEIAKNLSAYKGHESEGFHIEVTPEFCGTE